MTHHRPFLKGFLIGLSAFILLNILAAHLFSDCGMPAVLGLLGCSDDIVRVGFPFIFWEEGGIAFRSSFQPFILILDLILGIGLALVFGFQYRSRRKKENITTS